MRQCAGKMKKSFLARPLCIKKVTFNVPYNGHSYEGAEGIFELLSMYPLQYSFFHLFQPKRKVLLYPKPQNNDTGLSNFHFMEYDRESGAALGRYHSDVGMQVRFQSDPTEGLKKIEERQEGMSTRQMYYLFFILQISLDLFHSSISKH